MQMRAVLSMGCCLLVLACAAATPIAVPYSPQPWRVSDPATEAKALIESNTTPGCVSHPEVDDRMLTVKYVCRYSVGNAVLRFDRVQTIELQRAAEWYRVLVRQSGGAEDFVWSSRSLPDMQRLADSLAALSASPHTKVEKPTAPGMNL